MDCWKIFRNQNRKPSLELSTAPKDIMMTNKNQLIKI